MAHRLLALHVCYNIGVYPIILQFKYVIKFYQWAHIKKQKSRSSEREIHRGYRESEYAWTYGSLWLKKIIAFIEKIYNGDTIIFLIYSLWWLGIFSKWVVSRKASLDPSGYLPMNNESQTVLTVSLSQNDGAPLTKAILCSPCEKCEEQKRQFVLNLVRLILTQLAQKTQKCV